jgi:hypothetical protein
LIQSGDGPERYGAASRFDMTAILPPGHASAIGRACSDFLQTTPP